MMNTKPKVLSPAELGLLAKQMVAATDPKEVDQLVKEIMEGFYGRHFSAEELHLPPPSLEEFAREQQEWIAKFKSGEAKEVK